jgi:uncharacterized RDD family membrane protein YckC
MRNFSARETEWLQELDGIELADFWRRAFAFSIDWIIVGILMTLVFGLGFASWVGIRKLEGKPPLPESITSAVNDKTGNNDINVVIGPGFIVPKGAERSELQKLIDDVVDLLVAILYFGVLLWKGKGRTPGKRLMKIRVVSIVHRHLSFWHCVERAFGYGAAALEAGFGFIQFFIHPYRRCAQDRLAETIVVTERSYQALQHRLSHPLIPDGTSTPPPEGQPTAR